MIMGAAHSAEPRSVSMDNSTPIGVIDVSEDVVKRLKKGLTKQHQIQSKETTNTASSNASIGTKVPAAITGSQYQPAAPLHQTPTKSANIMPASLTFTAADVRRQKDDELQRNDQMWRDRLAKLEADLKKTNAIMEEEYQQSVENVRKRFTTAYANHGMPPCQDLKAKLISCYRDHPKETLLCAEDVAAFRNCVSMKHAPKLDIEQTGNAAVKVK